MRGPAEQAARESAAAIEAELIHQRTYDALTGALTPDELLRRLDRSRPEGSSHELFLLALDLDGFRLVNDALGHDAGDELLRQVAGLPCQVAGLLRQVAELPCQVAELLRQVAGLLRAALAPTDELARSVGDVFIVATEQPDAQAAEHLADRLRDTV